jgi:PTH1 family peptidyl-tRNA hydrolase
MKLIVGLGNPGKDYEGTRHNIGFMVVDHLAKFLDLRIDKKYEGSLYTQTIINGDKVYLLKPQKYINLSGESIFSFINYFKIDVDDIIIVSDDLDMQVGSYKLKGKGSSGGHNGLKNIELNLGTNEYKRLKIGISNNKNIDTKDYVLGKISKDEELILGEILDKTKNILIDFIKIDFISLMNKYNGQQ